MTHHDAIYLGIMSVATREMIDGFPVDFTKWATDAASAAERKLLETQPDGSLLTGEQAHVTAHIEEVVRRVLREELHIGTGGGGGRGRPAPFPER